MRKICMLLSLVAVYLICGSTSIAIWKDTSHKCGLQMHEYTDGAAIVSFCTGNDNADSFTIELPDDATPLCTEMQVCYCKVTIYEFKGEKAISSHTKVVTFYVMDGYNDLTPYKKMDDVIRFIHNGHGCVVITVPLKGGMEYNVSIPSKY